MPKLFTIILCSLGLTLLLASCSPYRVKKHPPNKAKISLGLKKKEPCGCH